MYLLEHDDFPVNRYARALVDSVGEDKDFVGRCANLAVDPQIHDACVGAASGYQTGAALARRIVGTIIGAGGSTGDLLALLQPTVPPGPPYEPGDVRVRAIEVNQSIQDWENSVQLVEGKDTAVRVFLEIGDLSLAEPVYGVLHGERNGEPLPLSPQVSINPARSVTPVSDAQPVRGDFNSSLNFVLPRSWTTGGDLTLRFDGGDTDLVCGADSDVVTSDCTVTVDFEEVPVPWVNYVGISRSGPGGPYDPTTTFTNTRVLHEQNFRVESTFPAPYVGHTAELAYQHFAGDPYVDAGDFITEANRWLLEHRESDGCFEAQGCHTIYYGVLLGDVIMGSAGEIPSYSAASFTLGQNSMHDSGFFRNTVPHELGHTLGLHHAVGPPDVVNAATCEIPSVDRDEAPPHPYNGTIAGTIDGTPESRSGAPLLGPRGETDTEIWGLDTRFARHYGDSPLTVVDPYETAALMGYCWAGSPQDVWTSAYEWHLLIDKIRDVYSPVGVSPSSTSSGTGTHLLVSGVLRTNESGDEIIDFGAVSAIERPYSEAAEGELRAQVWDGDVLLAEVPFTVPTHGAEGLREPGPGSGTPFLVAVPIQDLSYTRIVVLEGDTELGNLDASLNAPEVGNVRAVLENDDAGNRVVTVRWNADDADSDTLVANVRYSPDSGGSWSAAGTGVRGSSISVPVRQLHGSEAGIFSVQVSDGVRNSLLTFSQPVNVPDNAPEILSIEGLGDGQLASGGSAVWGSVVATDPEDGPLRGSEIVWRSHIDGVLSVGPQLIFSAPDLTEGLHLISAVATDTSGNTTATTGVLHVQHSPVYEGVPEVAPAGYLRLLGDALDGVDLHPGVARPLENTLSSVERDWDRDRVQQACSALERFELLVDNGIRARDGLSSEDAATLRGAASLAATQLGCSSD